MQLIVFGKIHHEIPSHHVLIAQSGFHHVHKAKTPGRSEWVSTLIEVEEDHTEGIDVPELVVDSLPYALVVHNHRVHELKSPSAEVFRIGGH